MPRKPSCGLFRHRRYGVYDLTYEDTPPLPFTLRIYSLLDGFRAICEKLPHVRRLLTDTIKLAPAQFTVYTMTTIWRGIYSAINLYLLSFLLDNLGNSFTSKVLSPEACRSLATSWFLCVMVNVVAERIHARSLELLAKRFRAHFIPQLIRTSLKVDLLSIQDLCSLFPVDGRFESEFPGGLFLKQSSQLVRCTVGLASQVFILLRAILCKRSPEREVLLSFCIARGAVWCLAPSNGISCSVHIFGAGYIYWPNNRHFQRMKALFGLAFSAQYRADLLLDGIASAIETEYSKSAEELGDVEVSEPTPWCTEFSRNWHWDFLMEITLDLPIVMYALILPTYLSPSSVASMALLQHATRSISSMMGQYAEDSSSLLDICSHAERLYVAVDHQSKMPRGTEPYPHPIDWSYEAGMKISFRHVSLRYPGNGRDALHNASFDISPGELVLVVGTNGSGKSSMLKLLARLFDPTAGDILVDDIPLVRYDMDQLRAAMAFQSQSSVVYPVTVRENIAFGLPPTFNLEQEHVDRAARMGDCSEWIARLGSGYDTQLQPSFDINCGWMDGVYGYPSDALKEELARHRGHQASISGRKRTVTWLKKGIDVETLPVDGEKQRLATARTFMRINNRTTRLVVVDEATSSLDPVAERDILTEFRNVRAGKTIIIVTHRFHHLAHEADRILCMKDGRVVESGTHAELVDVKGEYCALYQAQVG